MHQRHQDQHRQREEIGTDSIRDRRLSAYQQTQLQCAATANVRHADAAVPAASLQPGEKLALRSVLKRSAAAAAAAGTTVAASGASISHPPASPSPAS